MTTTAPAKILTSWNEYRRGWGRGAAARLRQGAATHYIQMRYTDSDQFSNTRSAVPSDFVRAFVYRGAGRDLQWRGFAKYFAANPVSASLSAVRGVIPLGRCKRDPFSL